MIGTLLDVIVKQLKSNGLNKGGESRLDLYPTQSIPTMYNLDFKQLKNKQMKKYLLILLVTLTASASSFAQFRIGPKLGANIGKIDGVGFKDSYKLGYHLGVFAEIPLGKKFAVQPEVLWNQINADTVSGFSSIYQNINQQNLSNPQLNYLSVPVLLSYKPGKMLTLQAGPQFGILINKDKNLFENGKEAFKNGDLSMLMGVQLNISRIRVYGRYAIGLSDISDITSQEKWKTTGFQVGLGLAL